MRSLLNPIPRIPRLTRPAPAKVLLACPRGSPQWELAALLALMKPQTRGPIEHRDGRQRWPRRAPAAIEKILARLGPQLEASFPAAGEYYFLAAVQRDQLASARAVAVAVSSAFPDLWLVIDRLFVHNGRFYRRRRGLKLQIVPAPDVHLPRPLRAAVVEVLKCEDLRCITKRSRPARVSR